MTVDKGGGELVELNLHKHSIRSANFRVQSWDSTNGYVEEHNSSNQAMPVRTYRGYVTENPNELITAVVDVDNTLDVTVHNGSGRIWTLSNINVVNELGNGGSVPPAPAPLSPGTAPAGAGLIPAVGLYQAHGVYDVPSSQYKGSVDATLAYIEYQWNVLDFFNARDAKLNEVLTEVIIRKTQFYTPTSGNAGQFSSMLRSEWLAQGQNERGHICSFFPTGFTFAGGYASGNSFYNTGGEPVAVNALYHELAHNWRAQHYYYGKDTMSGSHPAHGEMNAMRILSKRQQEIDEGDIQMVSSYATNLHPRAFLDTASTLVNTAVDIEPMANDWDANGDVISIKSHTTTTAKGGTVTEMAGVLTYTPAAGYVGKDIIVYEVQDTAGLYSQGLIHIEVVNEGLAAHWALEDTTGTSAGDSSGNGHPGALVSASFGANTVSGPVGNALAFSNGAYMIGDNSDLITEPETYYPLESAASNFFDPMDRSFTASCWFKLDEAGTAILMSKRNNGFFGYHLTASTNGLSAVVRPWDGNVGWYTVTSGGLVTGGWYHAAMVIDRNDHSLRLYLNGQEVGTAQTLPSNLPIFIGRADLKVGGASAVSIDEAKVYTKALSLAEIQTEYNAGQVPAIPVSPTHLSLNQPVSGTVLSWLAGNSSYEHDVYFGTDAVAVANATTASPEYQGRQSATTFDPGTLDFAKNYFWRIDEVDGSTVISGETWKFSTAANVLTSGLVLHLSMDDADVQTAEGTTHTYDDIALPGSDFQAVSSSSGATGVIGQAVDLSGTADSLRSYAVNPVLKPANGGVTVSFWINTSSTQNGGEKVYDAGGAYFIRYYNGDLMPVFDGSSGGAITMDANINDGQWHHVVATNDGSGTTTLYVDGSVVGTQSESLYNVGGLNRQMSIGAIYNGSSENLEALYDDFAVWQRALTAQEIAEIRSEGLAGRSFNSEPVLVDTSFEAEDGFTGFPSGNYASLGTVTDSDGVIWTEVTDAKIWNRSDIPPAGVQVLVLGLSSSNPVCDVEIPGTDHGLGTVSFDYAAFSGSTNNVVKLSYNAGSGWVEAWSTKMVGNNPDWQAKPWGTAEVAINVPGDVDLRFETTGTKGVLIDNVRVTGIPVSPNQAPVASDATFTVAENGAAGSSVGAVSASDPDAGDTLSYAITAGNGGGEFAINSSTGEITTTTVFDYETTNSYVLTVTVTDAGGLSDTATITVNVSNVNEAPVAVDASGSVAENVAVGTVVVNVSASDPDAGDTLSYTITSGNEGGDFTIDSNTGAISTANLLDYATTNSYVLVVGVTDSGGLSDSALVDITVTEVVDVLTSYTAQSETLVAGSVLSGSASDLAASDNVYEWLQEERTSGKPSNRVSSLENVWTYDIGSGGTLVELHVEAFHGANNEGDNFVFAYSTDGVNYTDLITVTKIADDNTTQIAPLPAGVNGTVYIRVKDTDRSPGNGSQEILYVDRVTLEVLN